MADEGLETEQGEESDHESVILRQKKENKELQGKIQALKHSVPKGDRNKKKEVALNISRLEAEQEQRHKKELEDFKNIKGQEASASERLEETKISTSECKMSRAQKRRAKKANMEQVKEQRIAAADIDNVNSARNVEAEKLKHLLGARNLEIFEITPDGHCLYNAVADQMRRMNVQTQMLTLRQQTADYMLFHQDEFLPFLAHPSSGEMYKPDQFRKYCEEVACTSAWGGQLELRALSHILHIPIEILQADAPVIKIGEEYQSQPVLLSYHRHAYGLGEHYNSVIPATKRHTSDS